MLEPQNFLDVQSVITRTSILSDPVDQHNDFWHGRIHSIEQAQLRFDLAVLDLFRARDDLASHSRSIVVVILS